MKHIYHNIYLAENFLEQTSVKNCCKANASLIIKCQKCSDLVCPYHFRSVTVDPDSEPLLTCQQQYLVCFKCYWGVVK